MKEYAVVAPMGTTFNVGTVLCNLSDDQIARRQRHLKRIGKNRHEVLSTVMFKRGETVGVEGPVNKVLLEEMAPAGSDAAVAVAGPGKRPKVKAQRIAAIAAAVDNLDRGDPTVWDAAGRPTVAALEAVMGWRPSSAERDAAAARAEKQGDETPPGETGGADDLPPAA